MPMDTWIVTGLYANQALHERIDKAHLRGALMALYEYIQGCNKDSDELLR